jgi:hypothetical protein
MKPRDWVEILRYLSLVTGIGLTMVVPVWLGWRLGNLVDGEFWPVAGILVGIGAGAISVYTMVKKFWE